MASLQELETGLRNAHAAGDAKAAQIFARGIQEERARQALPKKGSFVDALGQGATLGFADELSGLAGATFGTFDPALEGTTFGERFEGIRDIARDDLAGFRARDPGNASFGELVGGLGSGALAAPRVLANQGGGLLANTAKNVGAGGLLGAIYGVGSSDSESLPDIASDALDDALVGGAATAGFTGLGLLGRSAAKKLVKPETSSLHNKSVDILDDEGVPLTTGQQTGSNRVKAVETTLGQSLLGPRLDRVFDDQRMALQKGLMRKAGFDDVDIDQGLITDTAIANARDRFSQRYTEALKDVNVKLGNDEFVDALANVESRHQQFLPQQQKSEVSRLIDELIDSATDPKGITGKTYQAIRSRLGKRQRSLAQNDPTMAQFFQDMKSALDDAFMNSADDVVAKTKKGIDKEFARFSQIKKVFERGGGQQVESGILPLASLNRESKKSGVNDEWRGLIGAASRVLPDSVPNSGSISRGLNQVLPFGATSIAANAGTFMVPFAAQQALSRGLGGTLGRDLTPKMLADLRKRGLLAVSPANIAVLQDK